MKLLAAALLCVAAAACAAPPPSPTALVEQAAAKTAALKSVAFDLARVGEPVLLDPGRGILFSVAAGEYQAPDRVRARVKIAAAGTVLTLDMLWLPDGFYSSNPFTGSFEKLPAAPGFDPPALLRNEIPAVLRSELRSVTLVGTEKIGAADAYHVRAEADGAKLRALTGGVVVPGVHTVDLWIDVATSQIVRLADAEPGGVAGWRLELSGADKPVEIKAP
jgi:hypothetical protein